ncbi:glycerophosphodiester phosphodiesterase family protein [Proteinivorax tanatarense]|uniref:Glycerophosphodiester phosphodiesterase family protein n=1 Tax=Proteinivorax tanatarense TaxID=1260629 RepID=A0AAU7VNC4_9FIRM
MKIKVLKIVGVATLAILLVLTVFWFSLPLISQQRLGKELSQDLGVPSPAIIAHRGASHLAPESTAPAYKLARDIGADYLEADLQRTKDGVIVVFHDEALKRTSDIETVFPEKAEQPLSEFTYKELKQLDTGGWFNEKFPDQARDSYVGLNILTLDELIDIAESGNNNPGLYLETKFADKYPGIEKDIIEILERRGWIDGKPKFSDPERKVNDKLGVATVNVMERDSRLIFQSFYSHSIEEFNSLAPSVLRVTLISKDIEEKYGWENIIEETVATSDGIGPVGNLALPWRVNKVHKKGLIVHAYTINSPFQMRILHRSGVDGIFTDRPELALEVYDRTNQIELDKIFHNIGY